MIMSHSLPTSRFARFRPVLWIGVGLAFGYLAGSVMEMSRPARAEVTETPRRETFKDGSVLNEGVLREIAATLKRIETRVDRIEKNTTPAPAAAVKK
jgi:hypothetical protein